MWNGGKLDTVENLKVSKFETFETIERLQVWKFENWSLKTLIGTFAKHEKFESLKVWTLEFGTRIVGKFESFGTFESLNSLKRWTVKFESLKDCSKFESFNVWNAWTFGSFNSLTVYKFENWSSEIA